MNVISPRILPNSLQADGHPSFSESRLPARQCSEKLQARLNEVLQKSLNGLGSTIYQTALKQHTTPLGRQIFRLRASARRTSGSDASSVPSICDLPQVGWAKAASRDHKDSAGMATEAMNPDGTVRSRMDQLGRQVFLAGWATPDAQAMNVAADPVKHQERRDRLAAKHQNGNGAGLPIGQMAHLAGWPTAAASDGSGGGQVKRATNPARSNDLMDFAMLAGWPTAVANDDNKSPEAHLAMKSRMGERDGSGANRTAITSLQVMVQTVGPARLTASGELLTGSCAGMESGGQLSPLMSAWLMGYPEVWDQAAITAAETIKKRKRQMGRPAKPTPVKFCKSCGKQMERPRIDGKIEELATFVKRIYCNRACMAVGMEKDRCQSPSHSRAKANRHIKEACEACGATGKLHVHHKDEDPFNNDPSNLRTLCPRCHRRSHSPNFMDDGVTRKPCAHCARPSVKSGLCHTHLTRRQRFGDPLAVKVKTASGWVLDTSGLPIRSRRSPKESRGVSCASVDTAMQSSRKQRRTSSALSSAPSLKASKSRMSPWELLIQQTRLKICSANQHRVEHA